MNATTRGMIRGAVALALTSTLAACGGGEPEAEAAPPGDGTVTLSETQRASAGVRVAEVSPSEIRVPVVLPAELAPPDTALARIGSIVEGRVERVVVVPGDEVRAGQALAFIHSHEMADATRDLAAAVADLAYAQAAFDRSSALLDAGAVAAEEVERRRADVERARAEHARATEMVDHLDPSPDGDVTVRAPRAGLVLEVFVEPSAAVVPGDPVVEVGSVDHLWATAYVSEDHAARLSPGAEARVTLRALPGDTVEGRVVRVGGRVDAATRTVEIRVDVPSPPRGARPGMYATVELRGAESRTAVVVPADAVQFFEGRDVVLVEVAEGRYRPVPVSVLPVGEGQIAVEGIEAGTRVVVEGAYFIRAALEQGGLADEEGGQ